MAVSPLVCVIQLWNVPQPKLIYLGYHISSNCITDVLKKKNNFFLKMLIFPAAIFQKPSIYYLVFTHKIWDFFLFKTISKHWISFCTFKNLCFQKSQWWRGKFIFWHDIHYSKYCKSKNIINETWGIFFRENTYHLVKKEKKRK